MTEPVFPPFFRRQVFFHFLRSKGIGILLTIHNDYEGKNTQLSTLAAKRFTISGKAI